MSTQRKPEFIEDDLSEHAVHDYLEANLAFFEYRDTDIRAYSSLDSFLTAY